MSNLGDRLRSLLSRLPGLRPRVPRAPTLEPGEKIRVLYVVGKYPEFSETYMHEEMTSVSDEFDIEIVSYLEAGVPRRNFLPHRLVPYEDACINWGDFELVNTQFTNPKQQSFLERMQRVIEEHRPHIMHGHYFPTGLILRQLAERTGVPFTLRTHSFDMLQGVEKKTAALCDAVNSPLCVQVFTFPEFVDVFTRHGVPADKVSASWPIIHFERFRNEQKPPKTGRILCCGPCTEKKDHDRFIDLAESMRGTGLSFDLYTRGNSTDEIRRYNEACGEPLEIRYAEPEDMPAVYRNHDWLVYPSSAVRSEVGLPCSIVEAQASGIGVCWQEIPGRRDHQLAYLGGGGLLFDSIEDVPAIIQQPYPEEMRLRGLENAAKCDVERHREELSKTWKQGVRAV